MIPPRLDGLERIQHSFNNEIRLIGKLQFIGQETLPSIDPGSGLTFAFINFLICSCHSCNR